MPRQMKDSGIPWVGAIPEEWNIEKGKNMLKLLSRNVRDDDGVITCFRDGEVTLRANRRTEGYTFSDKEIGYQGIEPGDLVVHGMDGFAGAIGISDSRGKATPVLNVLDSDQNKTYLMYYLRSMAITGVFLALSTGIRVRSCDTNWNKIKELMFPMPPLEEQNKIAKYLELQCKSIDSVLEKTRNSIEEYKKLKHSVITQAVSKGVRGNRAMKDSGTEWIGELPCEVKVSRIGLHFYIVLGKMICSEPKTPDMREYPYYCAANVHFEGVDSSDLKKMWFTEMEIEQYQVKNGDLLVVEGGAGAGGCAIANSLNETIGIQNSIMIVRSKTHQDVRYLCYYLQSIVKRKYIDVVCNKATIPHFTKDKLSNVPYPVWSIEEQTEIADYLDEKCSAIDALIAKKEAFAAELENYKKSMIYEYVTGKKEVPQS